MHHSIISNKRCFLCEEIQPNDEKVIHYYSVWMNNRKILCVKCAKLVHDLYDSANIGAE